jgi:hypothetical protein
MVKNKENAGKIFGSLNKSWPFNRDSATGNLLNNV